MKNELEEQMKGLADNASLEDIMPGFDKEALWNDITNELHAEKPRQKRFLPGWVSHAAAVLLAIAGTWLFIHFNQRTAGHTAAVTTPAAVPQVSIKKETIAATPLQAPRSGDDKPVAPAEKHPVPDNHQHLAAPMALANGPAPAMIQPPPVPEVPEVVTPAPQPVLVAAKKTPRKVTHYLDLDPEDAAPVAAAVPAPPAFLQMKLNRPDIPNSAHQKTPLKELVVALAR